MEVSEQLGGELFWQYVFPYPHRNILPIPRYFVIQVTRHALDLRLLFNLEDSTLCILSSVNDKQDKAGNT